LVWRRRVGLRWCGTVIAPGRRDVDRPSPPAAAALKRERIWRADQQRENCRHSTAYQRIKGAVGTDAVAVHGDDEDR
jgi:hypothetical protein